MSRSFGSLRAVSSVSFTAQRGEITALIGPNGAGKTTMFNLIGGYQPLDSGVIRFDGREIQTLPPRDIARLGIGRTFQNLQLFDTMTVLENVMCGHYRLMRSGIFAISLRLPRVAAQEAEARHAARAALAFVGLDGAEALDPNALSFGHQRLVEIARALALRPELLLMDEPASGLNDVETERLSELILRIAALGITVLLVEHDMRLVMGLADHVVVMDHGEKMSSGTTETVRADPKVIAAYLGQAASSMLLEIQSLSSGYGRTPVLRDVSMTVGQGEIVALIGANGAGKSTLLNTIMGLVAISDGDISFAGQSIARLPTPAIVRAGIAQVPERRQLFGTMTVEENLLMGAYTAADRRAVPTLLEEQFVRFPILRERHRQAAQTLSGGQQQMLAIARSAMSRPRLLLLDEPSLGLAPLLVARIMQQIVAPARRRRHRPDRRTKRPCGAGCRRPRLRPGERPHRHRPAPPTELLHSAAVQDAYLVGHGGHFAIEYRIRDRKRAILGR